jgi:hypothetical protein
LSAKMISLPCVRLAMLVGLVKRVAPVRLQDRRERWGLLIVGRGFQRLLAKPHLQGDFIPATSRQCVAQPVSVRSKEGASWYATRLALLPAVSRPG